MWHSDQSHSIMVISPRSSMIATSSNFASDHNVAPVTSDGVHSPDGPEDILWICLEGESSCQAAAQPEAHTQ